MTDQPKEIESLGKDTEKLMIQKSRPLFELWKSDLTLSEFKIMDTYLSRIDSHCPERRRVIFEKGELESILGVSRIRTDDLKNRLMHLMGNVVTLTDKDDESGFTLVTLFEEARCEQDKFGMWEVRLECTEKAMKYFFNVEQLGYIRYRLKSITSLTSRYSYVMYMYLINNRFRGSWNVELDELKTILGAYDNKAYESYKEFNRTVLTKVWKELYEKTDCKYSYEPIKKGRTVIGLHIEIETAPEIEVIDAVPDENSVSSSFIELWECALEKENFSPEQIDELRNIICLIPEEYYPMSPDGATEDLSFKKFHLMARLRAAMEVANTKKKIAHRYEYLKKLLEKELAKANGRA